MKNGLFQKILPHLIAVVVFLLVAVIYCRPALEGKVLQQHDITQWKAMAQNSFKYKETHGSFPLWTNGMFSGMPAYQIAMDSDPSVSLGWFYYFITLGLPKPISFFFMACICFYILSQVLRINPYIGIIGAIAYATYNPVIIAAGHDTKMQAIAAMPALIGSVLLIYQRKYWLGAACTSLFTALLIGMNHPQISYYTFIILVFMTIGHIIYWIKEGMVKHMLIAGGVVLISAAPGVLSNAVSLFTTSEYAKESIRGGSELADAKSNTTKEGLSKEYALSYSMYKSEPFVMMVPKMFGGSSSMEIDQDNSKAVEVLQQMPQQLAQQLQYNLGSYWGGIGGTSGPPYVGAIICFLTLIGFFILDNKHKWWILAASLLAIMMSWGIYFEGFNTFLLNNLPMYNKFRAPSMTIVIPTFLFCMMAVMTLQKIVAFDDKAELWNRYKKGLMLTGGVFVLLLMIYFSLDFKSEGDKNLIAQTASAPQEVKTYVSSFVNALKDDRQSLFLGSLLRSLFFVAAAAALVWLRIRKNIAPGFLFGAIGLLAFIDVISIDTRYLNSDSYQEESEYEATFTPTPSDVQILQDTSYYRVFDLRQGISAALGSGYALPSYFHKSIGGYSAAKLSIYQDLIERQLSRFPQSMNVVNMLNTKYIIQTDQSGKDQVYTNSDALGAAWFVKAVREEKSASEVMNALTNLNPKDTAIIFAKDKDLVTVDGNNADSSSTIKLIKNDNDVVTYEANAATGRFAVFSEVFYDKGWKAYVDEKQVPIIRTNYMLRGLVIPAGHHNIRFEFRPASFYTGETIATIANLIIYMFMAAAIFVIYRKRNPEVKA